MSEVCLSRGVEWASLTDLQSAVVSAGVQLEVVDADGGDHVAFASGVTRAVREDNLIVAFTCAQHTQVLRERDRGKEK